MRWLRALINSTRKEIRHDRKSLPDGIFCNAVPISFSDDPNEFIRIVPLGDYPYHHNFPHKITREHVDEMAANFVRFSIDCLIDYDHESLWWGSTRAAGWISEVEARDDGLYAKYPEFTPAALTALQNREFRYFSPVYYLETNGKDGERMGAKLDSIALTNRPYFDEGEIDPVGNSQGLNGPAASDSSSKTDDDLEMERKGQLITVLGLPEDATDEQIEAAYNSKQAEMAAANAAPDKSTEKEVGGAPPTETPAETPAEPAVNSDPDVLARLGKLEEADASRETDDAESKVLALVNTAIAERKILPKFEQAYLRSARQDFDETKKELDAMAANATRPHRVETPNTGSNGPAINNGLGSMVAPDAMKYVNDLT